MDTKSIVASVANRFKEPSSWAGLSGLLALAHISADPGLVSSVTFIGVGVAGVVAFFLPEKKT